MNIVLNIFTNQQNTFDVPIQEVLGNSLILTELEVVLVRIITSTLTMCTEKGKNKSVEEFYDWGGKNQIVTLIELFLLFIDSDTLKSQTKIYFNALRNRCISRATSISCNLLKMDHTKESLDLVDLVFQQADRWLKYSLEKYPNDTSLLKNIGARGEVIIRSTIVGLVISSKRLEKSSSIIFIGKVYYNVVLLNCLFY